MRNTALIAPNLRPLYLAALLGYIVYRRTAKSKKNKNH